MKKTILKNLTDASSKIRKQREKLQKRKHVNGSLNIGIRKANVYYHYRVPDEKGNISTQYIRPKDRALVLSLAQQEYERKMIKASALSEAALERCAKILNKCVFPEDIYETLSPERKALVYKVDSDEAYAAQWYEINKRPKQPLKDGARAYKTENGEYVKSKSELMIANRLKARGIVYVYEPEVWVCEGLKLRKPDFLILNKRTRKAYYWEHLGMLDTPSYVADNVLKFREYEENGMVIGRDILITIENKENPLDTSMIDDVIDAFLV